MNPSDLTIEAHYRQTAAIVDSCKRALETAEEQGSLRDWLQAVDTSAKIQDFAGRELVRYRVRKTLCEAAGVLSGEFDGQENVTLGSWADGISPDDIAERAQEILDANEGLF